MQDQKGTLLAKKLIAQDTFEMLFQPEYDVRILPGQFVHVKTPDGFLRRPMSVSHYDVSTNVLRLIVQRVGKGTQSLVNMLPGETTRLLVPVGNLFPLEQGKISGSLWLVGGGIGIAPLLYIPTYLHGLHNTNFTTRSFLGFRGQEQSFDVEAFEKYGKTDVALGGFVTDLVLEALKTTQPDYVFACGPTPFMKTLQKICAEHKLNAYASLEEHMGCGIGACLVCNCKIRVQDGFVYKRVCCDGPVFPLAEVMFA